MQRLGGRRGPHLCGPTRLHRRGEPKPLSQLLDEQICVNMCEGCFQGCGTALRLGTVGTGKPEHRGPGLRKTKRKALGFDPCGGGPSERQFTLTLARHGSCRPAPPQEHQRWTGERIDGMPLSTTVHMIDGIALVVPFNQAGLDQF